MLTKNLKENVRFNTDEFVERYASKFQHEMFRLETLPSYGDDMSEITSYLSGEELKKFADDMPWRVNLARQVDSGKVCSRVHLVNEPLSDYLTWEIDWAYPQNAKLGEIIRVVNFEDAETINTDPNARLLLSSDWQLIDDRSLIFVRYNHNGVYEYHELNDNPALVKAAVSVKNALMTMGTLVRPEQ